MTFEPIAIIGQSCLLPGALSPSALWDIAVNGKDAITQVPEGYWRTATELVWADSPKEALDRTWSDRGGYVRGFETIFDPDNFAIPAEEILTFDPLILWIIHTAREALIDAGQQNHKGLRAGATFGNLSYPSHGLNRFAESTWLSAQGKGSLGGRPCPVYWLWWCYGTVFTIQLIL